MEKIDIGFVILNYLAYKQTIQSIASIEKNALNYSYKIIVVENGSYNESFSIIENETKGHKNVILLKNEDNLGFARGNNIGIDYLKKNYDAEFITVLNNDVYLRCTDFYEIVKKEYEKSEFAIAGPLVETKDGLFISNPLKQKGITISEALNYRKHLRLNCFLVNHGMVFIYKTIRYLKLLKQKIMYPNKLDTSYIPKKQYGIVLHGCCLIFSNIYFKYFDGFNPETFLFLEEEILFARCSRKGIKTVFLPELKVFHEEDASTNIILKTNNISRVRFEMENHLKSVNVLINELYQ